MRRRGMLPGWLLAFRAGAGRARGFLRFWPVWEAITRRVWHVRSIPGAEDGLFEVRFFRYRGQPATLPDGSVIVKGDRVVELHVRNDAMIEFGESLSFRQAFGGMRRSLRGLAAWSYRGDFPPGVRAVYGRSLLARAAPRLGFTTREVPRTVHLRLERFFLLGIMVMYHSRGRDRLSHGTTYSRYPVECWLSLGDLRRRYDETAKTASLPPAEA